MSRPRRGWIRGQSRGVVPPMSLKITNPEIRDRRVLEGDLDRAGSPWAGMSGAVVVTADDLVVGVVRGHSPAEGTGSLTATRLEAITSLPEDVARRFLTALQMTDPREWPRVPLPADDRSGVARARRSGGGRGDSARAARVRGTGDAGTAGRCCRARAVAVVCAVTGLRGVGKTQIAAAYARARVSEGWGLVGWVNAETRDTLLTGLARVAERLGVADPEGDSLESARRLREHLQTRDQCGPAGVRQRGRPGRAAAVPARHGQHPGGGHQHRPGVRRARSRPWTWRRSAGRSRCATCRHGPDWPIEAGAAAVARELGDLPLGLAQAAASDQPPAPDLPEVPGAAAPGAGPGTAGPASPAGTTRARPLRRCCCPSRPPRPATRPG